MEASQKQPLANPVPILLVVDDDAAVRHSLKFSLEIEGFDVRLYPDAGALLKEPSLPSFGCLMIDYYLPDMSGLELLARLRGRGATLPAFLITGHPSIALRQRAKEAGVTTLEKPLFGNGLVETIRSALEHHGQHFKTRGAGEC